MGKAIIISGSDYSVNAIPVAKAVVNTVSPQYVYVANVVTPPADFDWDTCKQEILISVDGSITNLNLPNNTAALPSFVCGAGRNSWLKEIDLSYLSQFPITSLRTMLRSCDSLEKVVLDGKFNYLIGTAAVQYFLYQSRASEVIIKESFNAPNLTSLDSMFSGADVRSIKGLKNLITASIKSVEALFGNCSVQEIDLTGCDFSNVTSFNYLFKNCISLKKFIAINEIDTSKVTSFTDAFFGCGSTGNFGTLDISNWTIANNANTKRMFYDASVYELNANCLNALNGDVAGMFYIKGWNTIHLDNLNDVSGITESTNFFRNNVSGRPKVTIANVTNQDVKTFLINALNTSAVWGSSTWHESIIDSVLCLVP